MRDQAIASLTPSPSDSPTADSPTAAHLLVVDDDPDVGQAMQSFFEMRGFAVTRARNGEEALELLRDDASFDIVTLDVNMPGIDGFEVLRRSQEMGVTAPILMVTARGEQEDVLHGLGLGARDYVVKPFDADDLVARVERLLGLTGGDQDVPAVVRVGLAEVDFAEGVVRRGEHVLALEEQEQDVLRVLLENQGEVVSRRRLLKEAWGLDSNHVSFSVNPEVVSRALEKHIEALRLKIEATPGQPKHLETVIGLGYRLKK